MKTTKESTQIEEVIADIEAFDEQESKSEIEAIKNITEMLDKLAPDIQFRIAQWMFSKYVGVPRSFLPTLPDIITKEEKSRPKISEIVMYAAPPDWTTVQGDRWK